ncbi:murein L,D-transpeptidase catalytic domain family protein [Novosphingobium resinovorum]|uniref:murein L,D-transpeptidase catalytic domain family protein n=1 Tax=Novosphingobium resinovorum TaxID=158500 RepID=UPI002ECFC2E3|nr:murein L,D-transpeptidase catalytic domain family protein [Novosphingobium resinovorum]
MMMAGAAMVVGACSRSSSPLKSTAAGAMPGAPAATAPSIPAAVRGDRPPRAFSTVDPGLLRKALASLDRHSARIKARDRIAIVDFSASSSDMRMHFLDVVDGKASRLLVAHGSGSDPHHTGFVERFSNAFGSNASSEGAFLTEDYYVGKHGRSQRLIGLDATNSNALDRAVVIHSAWYANEDMIRAHGKLGRSQGCFAVGENKLDDVFSFLGKGRMIFAARA